jgi:hypothetical protein
MSLIKLKNNALDNLTSFEGSASLGDMVLVSSATASSSASIEFTLGDLKEYKFFFVNIHPSIDQPLFTFNFSSDNGSNYNVTKTSSYFRAHHNESDTETILGYDGGLDLAQSTSFQRITSAVGGDNDQCMNGILSVFNPSSTTFVKHYIGHSAIAEGSNFMRDDYYAGYANTTSALTNIKFQMDSGNIDDGKILLFGIN